MSVLPLACVVVQATTGAPVESIVMLGFNVVVSPADTPAAAAVPLALPPSCTHTPPTSWATNTCGLPLRVSTQATYCEPLPSTATAGAVARLAGSPDSPKPVALPP